MILVDENISAVIARRLEADGHDVVEIRATDPSITDTEILRRAVRHGAIVLTDDKDFGELVFLRGHTHRGVVLLRLSGVPHAQRAEMVSALFASCGGQLAGAFAVLHADGRVRIRRS